MAGLTTALIVGGALAAGGASVYGAKKQARAMKNASADAERLQNQALARAETQRRRDSVEGEALARRSREAAALIRRRAGGDGRAATLLTGPGGLGGSTATTQRATLLGL